MQHDRAFQQVENMDIHWYTHNIRETNLMIILHITHFGCFSTEDGSFGPSLGKAAENDKDGLEGQVPEKLR